MNVFLMGMPGSGKTTTGKKLAKKLHLDFFDLDEIVATRFGNSVNNIFASHGEDFFRQLESECLTRFLNERKNYLLSLGGGTPCYFNNLQQIQQHGITVYLELAPEVICQRILQGKENRPLFVGLNEFQLLEKVKTLLNQRETFYHQATVTVNALSLNLNSLSEQVRLK